MEILIATRNPGKALEIDSFLGKDFEVISLKNLSEAPDIEETGTTFEENAVLKAKKYFEWSGIPCVADDAGLEIDYLVGEPGVLSRRWPGYEATDQELIDMTLRKMNGVPNAMRSAHLVAVGAYYDGVNIITERGTIDGYIVNEQKIECEPGYPFRAIFWVPRFRKLYRDLTHEEHEQINHRKVVYQKLSKKILQLGK